MQCASNRRVDMLRVRPVPATLGHPAPSATPSGPASPWPMSYAAGAESGEALHVAFQACDLCEMDVKRCRYAASVPMAKAMSPEVLLAFAMNGEPLALEHGYPLRVVVPGFAGVRSPKWLEAIIVQDRPADGHVQTRLQAVPAGRGQGNRSWDSGVTINDMPLNSAICEPAAHAVLQSSRTTLRGYASPTARLYARCQAALEHDPAAPRSWTFWRAELDLPVGEHELAVRAWDSAGQTQPALPDDTWNFKGHLAKPGTVSRSESADAFWLHDPASSYDPKCRSGNQRYPDQQKHDPERQNLGIR